MKRLIHTAVLAAVLAFALLLCGCSGAETSHKAPQRAAVESGERQFAQPSDGDFIAIFSTSLGEVRAVLYPDAAPMAVQNFVVLAGRGFYDHMLIWLANYGFAVHVGDS
ncbi:peptidylprolyl isomerase, partial [Oscillospiraceae bacterium SCCA1]|nr:peptidylprolyl isomerase [Oscillospiraceae bacterium SCCA1]